ncbi:restriction endonuclease [Micromonospora zhanjiangensis]|uniref:Restriction endonuclease n=1 Tax=Micromonospora zhanjiangensis TaxID=1522057 RepID=A0ABV8KS78_9ACTN
MQRAHAQQVHAEQRQRAVSYQQHQQMVWAAENAHKAAERAAAADERERRRLYLDARAARVEAANADLRARLNELDNLLLTTLAIDDHIDLNRLKKRAAYPPFEPGALEKPAIAPDWRRFAPPAPTGLGRVLGGDNRHQQQLADAEKAFALAQEKHTAAEAARQRRLAEARARYERRCRQIDEQVAAHNAEIDRFAATLAAAEPAAVVEYFGLVLGNSVYPDDFPQRYRLAYLPESRQIVVEYQLPTIDVIPALREYTFDRARDKVTTAARPQAEIGRRYAGVVMQVALRTVHELFEADRSRLVETIVFNGIVDTVDRGTGHSVRPCLVTLRTVRDAFVDIDLAKVDPAACLEHLKATVSPRPETLAPVRPVVEFDAVDNRFTDEVDVLADVDHRPNLQTLPAAEFERLVEDLFGRLGLETRQSRVTPGGDVDCVAVDPRPIFGGKVVVQARRPREVVDVSAVRDLFGTVVDEGATKGILITTRGYSPEAFEFASGKPLELIDGANLLYLLAEHTDVRARIDTVDSPVPDGGRDLTGS